MTAVDNFWSSIHKAIFLVAAGNMAGTMCYSVAELPVQLSPTFPAALESMHMVPKEQKGVA